MPMPVEVLSSIMIRHLLSPSASLSLTHSLVMGVVDHNISTLADQECQSPVEPACSFWTFLTGQKKNADYSASAYMRLGKTKNLSWLSVKGLIVCWCALIGLLITVLSCVLMDVSRWPWPGRAGGRSPLIICYDELFWQEPICVRN